MTVKNPTKMRNPEEMDSASRRDFMKVAGIGALGLAYINPVVETLSGGNQLGNYDPPQGIPSSSNPDNPSSSYPGPSSSSLPNG